MSKTISLPKLQDSLAAAELCADTAELFDLPTTEYALRAFIRFLREELYKRERARLSEWSKHQP